MIEDLQRRMSALALSDKFKVLKNSFKGQECYIVGCGPSLKEIDPIELRHKLSNKLVISIKQAYRLLPNETDFHVFNYVHTDVYNYVKRPIVLELTRFGKVLSPDPDLAVPIDVRTAGRYSHSVVATKRFDDFTFDRSILRPFGPGIMYEVCFFLAVHLGASGITTLGFDVAKLKSHFYGPDETVSESKERILGKEQKDVINGMVAFSEWLEKKGCPLKIISSLNPAPSSIPRLRFEDI